MQHTPLSGALEDGANTADHAETLDLIMSSDGESPMIFKPPPHIAARFSRSARRKSASSSRRNSMSSLHSGRSNRSCHGGIYSTHIAQHLRRASIIENRKARLADQAAHAEKVRLRAQLAKATPRPSRSEDRALAAQQARERHLAQVAASCAEEVKRAKKIAEETREKKAAEHVKLKGEMEEKLADAEKRRLLYQQNLRRYRTTSLTVGEEKKPLSVERKPKNEDAAARMIQKAWRDFQRRKIVSEFLQLDLDVTHVQNSSFEEIGSLLGQERVLSRTTKMMRLCGLQEAPSMESPDNTDVRIFLSAFLILGHPKQVLSHGGDQEEDLIGKAKVLLMQFERVILNASKEQTFSPSSELILTLCEAYSDFQLAFTAWKNQDSSILIETMLAQFAELDAIWQNVKNDTAGNVAADYHEGIRYNQTLLLARLKRLAGPEKALKMINEAIKARRKSKTKKKVFGDVKPRTATGPTEAERFSLGSSSRNSSTPSGPVSSPKQSLQKNEFNKVIATMPQNRVLIHELAINKDYRIDVDQASESRRKVDRAVFNAMRSDLEAGLGHEWIMSMVEAIREKLLTVVPPNKPLSGQISESLDLTIISNQLRIGSFSYEKFFSFMTSILPKLVSPARDPLVRALAANTSDDLVERLAKLTDIINLLSLDYANYLLQISAPDLLKRASEYEANQFQREIANRKLSRTIRWWQRAQARSITDQSQRLPGGTLSLTAPKVYINGLVDLFIALPPLEAIDVPETLSLDSSRIERIRADILHIITIASILLTAKNLLKRDVRSQWKTQAQRMWDLPDSTAYADPTPYLSIVETAFILPPAVRASLVGTIPRILADARNSPDISHPVMKVLLQKIKAHSLTRLGASSSEERVRSTTTAGEVLGSGGMVEFAGRISSIVDEMVKVKQVDWDSHGKWLDEVAAEVSGEATTL